MKTIEDMMIFCNAAVLFNYEKEGIVEEFDLLRNCMIKNFRAKIPAETMIVSLSVIDEIMLKINDCKRKRILG